jgi:hypothetical protein
MGTRGTPLRDKGTRGHGGLVQGASWQVGTVTRGRYKEAKIQRPKDTGRQNTDPKIQGGVGPSGI